MLPVGPSDLRWQGQAVRIDGEPGIIAMRALLIVGLSLTVAGSLALSWRDLRGGGRATVGALERGLPRTGAAWVGFPLIAAGTALQIIAVVIG